MTSRAVRSSTTSRSSRRTLAACLAVSVLAATTSASAAPGANDTANRSVSAKTESGGTNAASRASLASRVGGWVRSLGGSGRSATPSTSVRSTSMGGARSTANAGGTATRVSATGFGDHAAPATVAVARESASAPSDHPGRAANLEVVGPRLPPVRLADEGWSKPDARSHAGGNTSVSAVRSVSKAGRPYNEIYHRFADANGSSTTHALVAKSTETWHETVRGIGGAAVGPWSRVETSHSNGTRNVQLSRTVVGADGKHFEERKGAMYDATGKLRETRQLLPAAAPGRGYPLGEPSHLETTMRDGSRMTQSTRQVTVNGRAHTQTEWSRTGADGNRIDSGVHSIPNP